MNALAPRARTLPIRDRVTIWYAGSLMTLLVITALLVRVAFVHALSREFDRSLSASAELARSFYESELREYGATEATLFHIGSELAFPDRYIEFVRPDGTILAPRLRRPLPTPAATRRREEPLDAARAPGWRVRVVGSTLPLARPIRQVTGLFLLGIPLAVAVAASIGRWLAGRMLRPVTDMADATEHVMAGSGKRLPIGNPGDELGRLGARFNLLLDRLDAALQQQRTFLADAAHELRTPLSRILSGVDLALLDQAPADTHIVALVRARSDLMRTGRLVDELMQLARMDITGSAGVESTARAALLPLFLDDVVSDACARWGAAAQQAQVRLTQSVLEEAPVDADAVLLERLIGVLVDNAIRYTPPTGTVDVRTMLEASGAVLEVADTGIGIAADDIPRVTERFYRSAIARSLQPDGSGLGLAIASGIADAHSATLTIHAVPGGGTVVRVAFPASARAVGARS